MMPPYPWYAEVEGNELEQGDLFEFVPVFDFGEDATDLLTVEVGLSAGTRPITRTPESLRRDVTLCLAIR